MLTKLHTGNGCQCWIYYTEKCRVDFFLAVGRLSLIWSVFFTVSFPFPVTFVPLMEGGREGARAAASIDAGLVLMKIKKPPKANFERGCSTVKKR